MCDCDYPMSTVTMRMAVDGKLRADGMVKTVIFSDCLLCGPSEETAWLLPTFVNGHLLASEAIQPMHACTSDILPANRIKKWTRR